MVTSREVANLFLGQDQDEDPTQGGPLRTVSVRMPSGRLAWVDAMAENAGLSRNEMLVQLIAVGIGAVLAELPDPIRDEIHETVVENTQGGQ